MKMLCDVQDAELHAVRMRLEPHLSESAELIFRQSASKDSWFFSLSDVSIGLYFTLTWPGKRSEVLSLLKDFVEDLCTVRGWNLRQAH